MNLVEGKWTGFYEYGLGYELPYFGQRVKFSVELTLENGNIHGISKEEKSAYYVNADAKIEGYEDEDFTSFIKTYPVYPFIDENKEIQSKKGKLVICHTGIIDEEKNTMYGSWFIQDKNAVQGYECEGIWLLVKSLGDFN